MKSTSQHWSLNLTITGWHTHHSGHLALTRYIHTCNHKLSWFHYSHSSCKAVRWFCNFHSSLSCLWYTTQRTEQGSGPHLLYWTHSFLGKYRITHSSIHNKLLFQNHLFTNLHCTLYFKNTSTPKLIILSSWEQNTQKQVTIKQKIMFTINHTWKYKVFCSP